ncbi:hypothetical protein HW555_008251 [Spodoptera exigua]|uniref:Uncharacterized protein n=1 Tax=Spodoptera exigua TaxID=7107 RepID=A0A835GFE1_SPOEX|nr:hypothetical protein HW555_008251 [Spodoptera exigua]
MTSAELGKSLTPDLGASNYSKAHTSPTSCNGRGTTCTLVAYLYELRLLFPEAPRHFASVLSRSSRQLRC